MDNPSILGMQIVEEMMMDFRKAALARSSLMVGVSLSLSLVGRYGFDRGFGRHGFMAASAAVLAAATMMLIFDLRKSNTVCAVGR